jgi:hypothetical protein
MNRYSNAFSQSAHSNVSIGVRRWRLGVLCARSAAMGTIAPFFLHSKQKKRFK